MASAWPGYIGYRQPVGPVIYFRILAVLIRRRIKLFRFTCSDSGTGRSSHPMRELHLRQACTSDMIASSTSRLSLELQVCVGTTPFSRRNYLCVNFGSGESRRLYEEEQLLRYQLITQKERHELFSSTTAKLDSEDGNEEKEIINVTFVEKDGEETHIKVPVGMSMLEAAHENDIDLEGACEGSLACSTCHVIVMDVDHYNKLPDPTDEENDMLDLAFGLTETSRLGCQIIAKPELDGLRLAIPAATRNFAVDGFKPKPH
ncbi:Adrenodoxin-like protein 2, mitochondrial [Sesamum angolense]|uniref:Adrenodoxin-like protein 2, mitochondrial n=2 Tax=Sesamum TaxID=4181 RepID=A0AAE1XGB2_9LAMI|nr:Adrenodoxin-like protein 2, mitochondrial [Sesamum angolense]